MTASLLPKTQARRRPTCLRANYHPGGFTLVELLVATTVTLLLVVVLVQVFNGASSTWRHSEAQVDAFREARGAMQLMARDLSTTLQASYAQAGGGADPTPAPGAPAIDPAMPTLVFRRYSGRTSPANEPINEEVYCLTNISNRGASSLCAVGYFCQWMADSDMFPAGSGTDARPRAFALMRQSLDSDGTFKRMQAVASSTRLSFLNLYERNLYAAPSNATPPLAVATPVAAYVWDLRFRIDTDLDDSTPPGTNTVVDASDPASAAAKDHSSPVRYYYGDSGQPHPPRLPAYVEIRFKALSSSAARQVEGNANVSQSTWNDTTPGFTPAGVYKQVILPNYQQFVLRVPLLNATPL